MILMVNYGNKRRLVVTRRVYVLLREWEPYWPTVSDNSLSCHSESNKLKTRYDYIRIMKRYSSRTQPSHPPQPPLQRILKKTRYGILVKRVRLTYQYIGRI